MHLFNLRKQDQRGPHPDYNEAPWLQILQGGHWSDTESLSQHSECRCQREFVGVTLWQDCMQAGLGLGSVVPGLTHHLLALLFSSRTPLLGFTGLKIHPESATLSQVQALLKLYFPFQQ